MPFVLKSTSSSGQIKDFFGLDFDTGAPLDHIHGAILALCNVGFANPRTRGALVNLAMNLSVLKASFSNIELFMRTAMADGEIKFRPDTPIHANDEARYQGGRQSDRADARARHFEFGAVGGGVRVVFDADIEEIYISAHYSFPAQLGANPGSPEADWLLTLKTRLIDECSLMADHSSGRTRAQRDEVTRLRALADKAEGAGLSVTLRDAVAKAERLDRSLRERATRNRAFAAWMLDSKANMAPESRRELYGV